MKIILFELNEVPQKIVDYFIRERPNSVLSKIYQRMTRYSTYSEDTFHDLSPWITWSTVHRGVIDEKHGIYNFGQNLTDVNKEFPPIWELLRRNSVSIGLFGSLHSYNSFPESTENVKFYFPDTFAASSECFPKKLSVFQDFNLSMVEKSSLIVNTSVNLTKAVKVLASLPSLGIKLSTLGKAAKQLVDERINRWKKIRRRTLQFSMAFDIFYKQLVETKPDFITFFSNNVASSMHRFWGACFSSEYEDKYNINLDDQWVSLYKNEIDFTMLAFDEYLAKLVKFVDKNQEYSLWITTSMGQSDVPPDFLVSSLFIEDYDKFFGHFGLSLNDWEKQNSMYPRYNFRIKKDKLRAFKKDMEQLFINGKEVYREYTDDFIMLKLYISCKAGESCISFKEKKFTLDDFGLVSREREDSKLTTAYHIPEGLLMIYDHKKRPETHSIPLSTSAIAPALLNNFGVKIPGYMAEDKAFV